MTPIGVATKCGQMADFFTLPNFSRGPVSPYNILAGYNILSMRKLIYFAAKKLATPLQLTY